MARVRGTSGNDFIHRTDDGYAGGGNEIGAVTAGNDVIDAGAGDDIVYADLGTDVVTLGTGNDFAYGDDGDDTLSGNAGNDILFGGQGADKMYGDVGYDTFRFAAASEISGLTETIDGGADIDTMDFRSIAGPVDLSLETIINVETLLFGSADITLTADQFSEFTTIAGGFATDRLILASAGTVNLSGASLSLIDEIRGSSGDDRFILSGVSEGETINTLDGNDRVIGGLGNDNVSGGIGVDRLLGGGGNDTLSGDDDRDVLSGDDGNDLLIGGAALDTISGGIGNDDIAFRYVSDISGLAEQIDGGADHDQLDFARYGASGAVDLTQAIISDVEELDLGGTQILLTAAQLGAFDTIRASFGYDTITLSAGGTADLTGASFDGLLDEIFGSAGDDTIILTGVATGLLVDGGAGADTLTGSDAADRLIGGAGSDTIAGGDGNDVIRGGQNLDHLSGGVGNDTFQFAGMSDISGLAETIDGGNDIDTLDFQTLGAIGPIDLSLATITSVETLDITNIDLTLTAAQLDAFTTINGYFSTERLILAASGTADLSNASINLIDEIRGSAGNDRIILTGVANGQTVNGMAGADRLTGGDGADLLAGGDGGDIIVGGAGADTIVGGNAADQLTGSTGMDRFRYDDIDDSAPAAADTIRDFRHGQDIVDLSAIDGDTEQGGNQGFSFIGAAAFSSSAGELRYSGGVLQADVNGDGVADFQINFANNATLSAADFSL